MRTGRIFWGVFFLCVGIVLLLARFDVLHLHFFSLWRYWPIFLVLWGVAILVGNRTAKWVIAVLAAITLAIILAGAISLPWVDNGSDEGVFVSERDYAEPYDASMGRASLIFNSGAGTFSIKDTTNELIAGSFHTSMGEYQFDHERIDDVEQVRVSLEGKKPVWRFGRWHNRAEVRLNPSPIWDMRFEVGAAKFDLDASPFKVGSLRVNSGASDVRVKLGSLADETHLAIHCGASSIRIQVPDSAGCEVKIDAPLSSKSLHGFEKMGNGRYRTENFDGAAKRISIDIGAGVSSIRVNRY